MTYTDTLYGAWCDMMMARAAGHHRNSALIINSRRDYTLKEARPGTTILVGQMAMASPMRQQQEMPMLPLAGSQPQMKVVQMQCPVGAAPGSSMAANIDGQMMNIVVPAGVNPGDMFQIRVPITPVKQALPQSFAQVADPFGLEAQDNSGGGDTSAEDVVLTVEGSRHTDINGSYRREMIGKDGKPDKHLHVKCGCEHFPRIIRGGGEWRMEVETKFLIFKGADAKHKKWPSMADQPPLTGWGRGVTVRYG